MEGRDERGESRGLLGVLPERDVAREDEARGGRRELELRVDEDEARLIFEYAAQMDELDGLRADETGTGA